MIPAKEKAKELFETYFCQLGYYYSAVDDEHAKKCALILCDEILGLDIYQSEEWYWSDVKNEIELL